MTVFPFSTHESGDSGIAGLTNIVLEVEGVSDTTRNLPIRGIATAPGKCRSLKA
jgi:hypothetical protein